MSEQIVKNLSVAIPKAEILTFACGNDFLAVLDNEANRDGIYIIDGQFPMESGASIDGNGPGIVKVIQEKFPNASVIGYSNRPQLFHDQKPPVIEKPVF